MKRKYISLGVLISALTISIVSNVVLINILFPFNNNQSLNTRDPYTFVLAISSDPKTIDPVDSLDRSSSLVLDQVIETLFTNDLRDPDLPRINLLAESYHWVNTTVLQIKIKEGISFHDGTPFSGLAAKWNLDRLLYLTNCTGANHGMVAQTRTLWVRPDGVTPIINNTKVIGEYNITITLNAPYGPFLNALTLISAGMISPTSHKSDFHAFIDITEKLVGTGPFIYVHYIPSVEIRLARWNGYRKHIAFFKIVQYEIYDGPNTCQNDFLNGQIDYIPEMSIYIASDQNIAIYEADSDIEVYHFTDKTSVPSLVYQYMSINNKKYNATWRKAISFAVNNTYIINDLRLGNAIRAYTAISPGYGAAFNNSLESDPNVVPDDGDITVARQTMVSMGFGDMGWSNAQWIAKAESATPFATVIYTYNLGNTFRTDLGIALTSWLKLIGVAINDDAVEWSQFLNYLYDIKELGNPDSGWDHIGMIYGINWAPDYLSPYNILQKLYHPLSSLNSAQVNDTKLNEMMDLALETNNDEARNIIYKNIQGYMAEQGFFHAPLYQQKIFYIHSADLRDFPYNAIEKFQAYGIWRAL